MGKLIVIANRKGGVGKTTLTLSLAVYLARAGLRVVAVDGDPQGNLTSLCLGGREDDGLYAMLVAKKLPPLTQMLRAVDFSGQRFAILGGDASTADALGMLALGQRLDEVQKRLVAIAQQVDLLLLDMPPSQALGFQQMLGAGDWLLVPTKMERLSIEGVGQMLALAMANRIRLMGIVPTMVRGVIEHREQGRELLAVLRESGVPDALWPPIPDSIRVAEAQAHGLTIYDYEPSNPAAVALQRTAQNVLSILRGAR